MPDSTPKKTIEARAGQSIRKIVCEDPCPQLHASSDSIFLVRLFARAAADLARSATPIGVNFY